MTPEREAAAVLALSLGPWQASEKEDKGRWTPVPPGLQTFLESIFSSVISGPLKNAFSKFPGLRLLLFDILQVWVTLLPSICRLETQPLAGEVVQRTRVFAVQAGGLDSVRA